ncbi:MAG: hypothetical protein ACFFE2_07285 [Candidatus Thorarchaeota archaeon]
MDSGDSEGREYEWSELEHPKPDPYHLYVFVAHIIIGIIISILSLSEGWVSWGLRLGAMPPLLLAITGGFYGITTGTTWFQNQFIPYITRISMIPEFETDRFLQYYRIHRYELLISGYISLIVTQMIWTRAASFILDLAGDFAQILELITIIYLGLLFLHVFLMLILFGIFELFVQTKYSDVKYIIALEQKMEDYFREKAKEEKEAKKAAAREDM